MPIISNWLKLKTHFFSTCFLFYNIATMGELADTASKARMSTKFIFVWMCVHPQLLFNRRIISYKVHITSYLTVTNSLQSIINKTKNTTKSSHYQIMRKHVPTIDKWSECVITLISNLLQNNLSREKASPQSASLTLKPWSTYSKSLPKW